MKMFGIYFVAASFHNIFSVFSLLLPLRMITSNFHLMSLLIFSLFYGMPLVLLFRNYRYLQIFEDISNSFTDICNYI